MMNDREIAEQWTLEGDLAEARHDITRLRAELERLEKLLNGRDEFIVAHDLWPEFVDSLPKRYPDG